MLYSLSLGTKMIWSLWKGEDSKIAPMRMLQALVGLGFFGIESPMCWIAWRYGSIHALVFSGDNHHDAHDIRFLFCKYDNEM